LTDRVAFYIALVLALSIGFDLLLNQGQILLFLAKKFLHFRKAGKAQYLTKAHEGRTLNACTLCHFRDRRNSDTVLIGSNKIGALFETFWQSVCDFEQSRLKFFDIRWGWHTGGSIGLCCNSLFGVHCHPFRNGLLTSYISQSSKIE